MGGGSTKRKWVIVCTVWPLILLSDHYFNTACEWYRPHTTPHTHVTTRQCVVFMLNKQRHVCSSRCRVIAWLGTAIFIGPLMQSILSEFTNVTNLLLSWVIGTRTLDICPSLYCAKMHVTSPRECESN